MWGQHSSVCLSLGHMITQSATLEICCCEFGHVLFCHLPHYRGNCIYGHLEFHKITSGNREVIQGQSKNKKLRRSQIYFLSSSATDKYANWKHYEEHLFFSVEVLLLDLSLMSLWWHSVFLDNTLLLYAVKCHILLLKYKVFDHIKTPLLFFFWSFVVLSLVMSVGEAGKNMIL